MVKGHGGVDQRKRMGQGGLRGQMSYREGVMSDAIYTIYQLKPCPSLSTHRM